MEPFRKAHTMKRIDTGDSKATELFKKKLANILQNYSRNDISALTKLSQESESPLPDFDITTYAKTNSAETAKNTLLNKICANGSQESQTNVSVTNLPENSCTKNVEMLTQTSERVVENHINKKTNKKKRKRKGSDNIDSYVQAQIENNDKYSDQDIVQKYVNKTDSIKEEFNPGCKNKLSKTNNVKISKTECEKNQFIKMNKIENMHVVEGTNKVFNKTNYGAKNEFGAKNESARRNYVKVNGEQILKEKYVDVVEKPHARNKDDASEGTNIPKKNYVLLNRDFEKIFDPISAELSHKKTYITFDGKMCPKVNDDQVNEDEIHHKKNYVKVNNEEWECMEADFPAKNFVRADEKLPSNHKSSEVTIEQEYKKNYVALKKKQTECTYITEGSAKNYVLRPPSYDSECDSVTSMEVQEIFKKKDGRNIKPQKRASNKIFNINHRNLPLDSKDHKSVPIESNDEILPNFEVAKPSTDFSIDEFFDEYSNFFTLPGTMQASPFTLEDFTTSQPTNYESSNLNNTEMVQSSNSFSVSNIKAENSQLEDKDTVDQTLNEELLESENITFINVDSGCVVIMRYPSILYFHGKLKACTLCGFLDVYGYKLSSSYEEIYAPLNGHALALSTVNEDFENFGLFGKLTKLGLSVADTEEIVINLGEHDVIAHFERVQDHCWDFVGNNFHVNLFSKNSKPLGHERFYEAGKVLGSSFYLQKPVRCLEESTQWENIVSFNLERNARTVFCGGKGVGKSTLLRYVTNRMIATTPVLLIDLDPGQAELTCAGNVSATVITEPLLGPNYTHLKKPNRILHIGMIDIFESVLRYIDAVNQIINECQNDSIMRELPWIINTMGLCNAVGVELMTFIIMKSQANLVVQLDSNTASKRFPVNFDRANMMNLYQKYMTRRQYAGLIPIVEDISHEFLMLRHEVGFNSSSNMKAKDLRCLNFLAYFGRCLKTGCNILEVVPYVVSFKDVDIGANVGIREHDMTKLLNGRIVALCRSFERQRFFRIQKPLVFIGYGLIRGVDTEKQELYIIAPLSLNQIQSVNKIIYSDWTPSINLDLRGLPNGTFVPYRTVVSRDDRRLLEAPKRMFNPIHLLRMKNTSQ